jgi:Smg protein
MLATLRERFATDSDIVEMESFLASNGLSRQEIGEVLSLYFTDAVAFQLPDEYIVAATRPDTGPSLRVQGPHERGRFTADAWGYLMMMLASGSVASFDFEQLIERALFHIDGRIGLPEIRSLADEVGLDAASLSSDRTLLH